MDKSTDTITQSQICNHDHSKVLKELKILRITFGLLLIIILFGAWFWLNLRTYYENLLRDVQDREDLYNNHIENTIVYLENLTDLLKKLKYPSYNRPPIIYNHIF